MGDVGDLGDRIGGTFEYHQACRQLREHPFDALQVLDRQHGMGDAELGEQMLHDIARRRVRFDEQQNVIAALAQRQQAHRDGRDARTGEQAVVPALQLAQQALQLPQGGVAGTRIEEPLALAALVAQRFIRIIEGEFHRLIDRRDQRPVVGGQHNLGRMIYTRVVFHGWNDNPNIAFALTEFPPAGAARVTGSE